MERSDKDYNGSFCSWFLVHSGKFVPKWRYIEAKKMMTATENCLLIFSIVSSSDFSCMTVRCEDKNWTGLWVNILVMPQIISLIISSVLVIVTDCECQRQCHIWNTSKKDSRNLCSLRYPQTTQNPKSQKLPTSKKIKQKKISQSVIPITWKRLSQW